ncbi:MAG: TrkA C-terminal domain-containing protein, partial [candidate division KSB1 bacterium]|nr:TrkA C-terminal domain-containing protein [candidate division KSB1 bacterium]
SKNEGVIANQERETTMTLWEKIRNDLQESAASLSSKASELLRSGATVIKEGAEKTATKLAYATKLAQLNWEQRSIQGRLDIELRQVGELLFHLHSENRLADLEREAASYFQRLVALEQELAKKEQEKRELPKAYGFESVDKEGLRELTKDLEAGGGTIMQVTIAEGATIIGKKLKEVALPKEALVGTIHRHDQILIPDGETIFEAGDKVSLIGKRNDVEQAIELLTS